MRGTEPPKIIINGNSFTLPTPKSNGREREEQVEIRDEFTNPDGDTVRFIEGYKFNGEYDFGKVGQNLIDTLKNELNKSNSKCTFYPYSGQDYASFKCYAEISGYNVNGNVSLKGMRIRVKQIGLDNKKIVDKDDIFIGSAFTPFVRCEDVEV